MSDPIDNNIPDPQDSSAAMDEHHTLDKEMQRRQAIVAQWRAQGWDYPNRVGAVEDAWKLHQQYGDTDRAQLEEKQVETSLAGRLMLIRRMGKASFVTLQDGGMPLVGEAAESAMGNNRIQLYFRSQDLDEQANALFANLDLGDIVCVSGKLFRTNKGELTVHVAQLSVLAKALIPHPEKHHGLVDQELCYRQRYLDLLTNPETVERFRNRAAVVRTLREELHQCDYLEVETPMLQSVASGAVARAFGTHHNSLGQDMFLRVAPELNLKRLIVGGYGRVYELNRNFRNEGLSRRHNPEFTMLEYYQAYGDVYTMMDLSEALCRASARVVYAGEEKFNYGEHSIDMGAPFERISMYAALKRHLGTLPEEAQLREPDVASACAREVGVKIQQGWGPGRLLLEMFEHCVEPSLIQPTFITDHPTEVSPLARQCEGDDYKTERFELFCGGCEIANGFSELNDPEEQQRRFEQQRQVREMGEDESMVADEDYIKALQYGMPPTGGAGIGVDRLVMLLTDSPTIRDVVLFPQLRTMGDGGSN